MVQKQDKLWIKWIHSYFIKFHIMEELQVQVHASWMVRKIRRSKEHLYLLHNTKIGKKKSDQASIYSYARKFY